MVSNIISLDSRVSLFINQAAEQNGLHLGYDFQDRCETLEHYYSIRNRPFFSSRAAVIHNNGNSVIFAVENQKYALAVQRIVIALNELGINARVEMNK